MSEPEAVTNAEAWSTFDESQCLNTQAVSAEDLNRAAGLLDQNGRIALCGPPKSGKSSLGHALLKHYQHKGFAAYLVHKLCCHFQTPVSEKGRSVVLMDGTLGVVRVNEGQVNACKDLRKRCLLIVTAYPHVLRDLAVLEDQDPCPLLPPDAVIRLEPRSQSAVDYLPLLKRMLHSNDSGHTVEALLALSMLGLSRFDQDPPRVKDDLQRLGFGDVIPYYLKQLAHLLKGSILHSTEPGFPSRLLYDAAGLALGTFYSLAVLLQACDGAFMVQHVRTTGAPTETLLVVGRAESVARETLMQRMYEMFVDGRMAELCQHPSLGCPEFMQDFQAFCAGHKNYVERLVSAVDRKHGLPLLYWSLWNKSTLLAQWCLTAMTERAASYKSLSKSVLSAVMAAVLFAETDLLRNQAKSLLAGVFANLNPASAETLTMTLPLPAEILAEEPAPKVKSKVAELKTGSVCYLEDPSMPVPAKLLSVTVTEEAVVVEVPPKHWYLAMRMLADRQRGETDKHGDTVLHLAADAGQLHAVKIAVKSGASVTVTNLKGRTPYELAQKRRRDEKGKISDLIASCHEACKAGYTEAVKVALCHKVRVNDKGGNGDTPLITACRARQHEIASLLIQLGAQVDSVGENGATPLLAACESGDMDIVRLLLRHGAKVHAKNVISWTPLHVACRNGHRDVAVALLERGAQVNAKDSKNSTPLHAACSNNHAPLAELLLLQHGADVNAKTAAGWTPLHAASYQGHVTAVDLLINHAARVNAKSNSGFTPLHCACREGRTEVAERLIQSEAELNARDKREWTPLHEACRRGHAEVAALLVQREADVTARNRSGETAADCARAGGHTSLANNLFP